VSLKNKLLNTRLIFIVFIAITLIQFVLTHILVQKLIEDTQEREIARSKTIFDSYLDMIKTELTRVHQGYTWWTEVSDTIKNLTKGETLPEDLLESWEKGNLDVNTLSLIVRNGYFIAAGGTGSDFWLKALSPNQWEELFSFYKQSPLSKQSFLVRDNRLLILLGSPSCDDQGTPLTDALHLFGIELDSHRLELLSKLSGNIFNRQPGQISIPSIDHDSIFHLRIVPIVDSVPIYSLSFVSIGIQVALNMIIFATLQFIIRLRTKMSLQNQSTVQALKESQAQAVQVVNLTKEDIQQSEFYNQKVSELEKLFKQLTLSSHKIIENTAVITGQIDNVQDGISAANAKIQAVNDLIHMTSENIKENANQANEMLQVIKELQQKIKEFETVASELNQEALEGLVTIRETLKSIKDVGMANHRVLEIIQVINDISDRTHLLAINAAIEASRAGQHGKGFNVVATEIRTLSETVASNTKQIEQVVKNISEKIQQAVSTTEILGGIFDKIADKSDENLIFVEKIQNLMEHQSTFSSHLTAQNKLMASIIQELELAINSNLDNLILTINNLNFLRSITDENVHTIDDLERKDQEVLSLLRQIREIPTRLTQKIKLAIEQLNQTA